MFIYEPVIEFRRRRIPILKSISQPSQAVNFLREKLCGPIEKFAVIYLNSANHVLYKMISEGTVDQTYIHPREVLRYALYYNSSRLILSHNHPSGNIQPSKSDKVLTESIKSACQLFNIDVLDHVIITEESYYSFNENGLL